MPDHARYCEPLACGNALNHTLKRNEDAGFRRSTGVVDCRRKVPLTCDNTEMR